MGAGGVCSGTNLPLFPLIYYRKEEPGHEMRYALFPFLCNLMRCADRPSDFSFSILVFLFRCGMRNGKFSLDFLWPFIHFSFDSSKHTFGLRLFPFVWVFGSPERLLIAILPVFLFYKRSNDPSYQGTGITCYTFPVFFFRYREHGSSVWFIFTVLLFFWIHRDEDYLSVVLAPFVWFFKDGSRWLFNLLFIFWLHKKYNYFSLVLFPFVWLFSTDDNFYTTVFPVVWYKHKKRKVNAANTLIEGYLYIVPFVWMYREGFTRVMVIVPIVFLSETMHAKTLGLFMLFWMKRPINDANKVIAFLPLFWYSHNPTTNATFVYVLLFGYYHAPGIKVIMLLPLFAVYVGEGSFLLGILFLFWVRKSDNKTTIFLLFFVMHTSEGVKLGSFMLLFWLYKSQNKTVVLFLPFVVFSGSSTGWFFCLFPFLWLRRSNTDNVSFFALVPFVWTKFKADSTFVLIIPAFLMSTKGERKTFGVTPLFWLSTTSDSLLVLFIPMFCFYKSKHTMLVGVLLFYYVKTRYTMVVLLFPIFLFGKDTGRPGGGFLLSVLLVFWVAKSKDWLVVVVLLFMMRNTRTSFRLTLFPFLWYYSDGDTHVFILLPFFCLGVGKNNWAVGITPLVWIIKLDSSVVVTMIPLFFIRFGSTFVLGLFAVIWVYHHRNHFFFCCAPFLWVDHESNSSVVTFVPLFFVRTGSTKVFSLLYLLWCWKSGSGCTVCFVDAFWAK